MSKTKIYANLRIYKGDKILTDENGNVANENQTVTIQTGTMEFEKYLKTVSVSGYGKVVIESCVKEDGTKVETPEDVQKLYDSIFSKRAQDATPENADKKRMAELEEQNAKLAERLAKLEANQNGNSGDGFVPTIPPATSQQSEPSNGNKETNPKTALRAEYKQLTGQNAPGVWGIDKLVSAIEEIKNKPANQ